MKIYDAIRDKTEQKVYIQRTASETGQTTLHRLPSRNAYRIIGLPGQPQPDVVIGLFNAWDLASCRYASAFSTAAIRCNTSESPRSAQ